MSNEQITSLRKKRVWLSVVTATIVAVAAITFAGDINQAEAWGCPGHPPVVDNGSISGIKYLDQNKNGVIDAGETALAGWDIVLKDAAGNVLKNAVTDGSGQYTFNNLAAGDYVVSEGTNAGKQPFIQTLPMSPNKLTIFHLINSIGSLTVDDFSLTNGTSTANLIDNPSLETTDANGLPANWLQGNWGTNTTEFTYPVDGYDGTKAAQVAMSAYTDGDAKWYFTPMAITPGNYTISDYYKSDIVSYLIAQIIDSDGVNHFYNLLTLDPASGWTSATTTLDITPEMAPANLDYKINLSKDQVIAGINFANADSSLCSKTESSAGCSADSKRTHHYTYNYAYCGADSNVEVDDATCACVKNDTPADCSRDGYRAHNITRNFVYCGANSTDDVEDSTCACSEIETGRICTGNDTADATYTHNYAYCGTDITKSIDDMSCNSQYECGNWQDLECSLDSVRHQQRTCEDQYNGSKTEDRQNADATCACAYSDWQSVCASDGFAAQTRTQTSGFDYCTNTQQTVVSGDCACKYSDWTNGACQNFNTRKQTRTLLSTFAYCASALEQNVTDDTCSNGEGGGGNDGGNATSTTPICGNSVVEKGETCDENSQSCTINGYEGTQKCNNTCSGFSNCITTEVCGDGIKNGREQCDDTDGISVGQTCSSTCQIVTPGTPVCGDGVVNQKSEQCESSMTKTCMTVNGASGRKTCNATTCTWNTTCQGPVSKTPAYPGGFALGFGPNPNGRRVAGAQTVQMSDEEIMLRIRLLKAQISLLTLQMQAMSLTGTTLLPVTGQATTTSEINEPATGPVTIAPSQPETPATGQTQPGITAPTTGTPEITIPLGGTPSTQTNTNTGSKPGLVQSIVDYFKGLFKF